MRSGTRVARDLVTAAVGSLMALGICAEIASSDQATVQATSDLAGDYQPGDSSKDSGVVPALGGAAAVVNDSVMFTDPETGSSVSGTVSVSSSPGTYRMSANLSSDAGPQSTDIGTGLTCNLEALEDDYATVTIQPGASEAGEDLRLSEHLDGDVTGDGELWSAGIQLNVTITNLGSQANPKNLKYVIHEADYTGYDGHHSSQSGPTQFQVDDGDQLQLHIDETLEGSEAFFDGDSASMNASYDHTTHVYIDPLEPGVTVAFASGHDYTTPAPEPAGQAPAAAALLALVAWVRRSRRAR